MVSYFVAKMSLFHSKLDNPIRRYFLNVPEHNPVISGQLDVLLAADALGKDGVNMNRAAFSRRLRDAVFTVAEVAVALVFLAWILRETYLSLANILLWQ